MSKHKIISHNTKAKDKKNLGKASIPLDYCFCVYYMLPSEPVVRLYIYDTDAHLYSMLYGSVKSLSLKDICLCLCEMCTTYAHLQIWNQYTDSN